MSNNTDRQVLRYLPVDIGGQLFAIPMAEVVNVHQMHEQTADKAFPSEPDEHSTPVVNLKSLFWGEEVPGQHAHAIMISTPVGACAVLVDAIQAATTADASLRDSLPPLISMMECPFSGVIRGPEELVLIIDCERLIAQLRQVAPELIVEQAHAA